MGVVEMAEMIGWCSLLDRADLRRIFVLFL